MIRTDYPEMIDFIADEGKDLLSPDGTMRAKHVSLPVDATLWTEVEEEKLEEE